MPPPTFELPTKNFMMKIGAAAACSLGLQARASKPD
jgi:hypothetical protein